MPKLEDTLSKPLKYQSKSVGSKPEPDIIFSPEEKAEVLTVIANTEDVNKLLDKLRSYNTATKNSVDRDNTEEERDVAAKKSSEFRLTDGEKKLAKAISQQGRAYSTQTIETQVRGYHSEIQAQITQAKNKIAAAEDGFDRIDHSDFTPQEKARAAQNKSNFSALRQFASSMVNRLTGKPEVRGGHSTHTAEVSIAQKKVVDKGPQRN